MVNVIQILFIYIYNAIIKINIDKESNFEARCCGQYLIKISNTLRQLLNYIQDRDIHSIYKFYICLCIFKYYTKHIVIRKQQLLKHERFIKLFMCNFINHVTRSGHNL